MPMTSSDASKNIREFTKGDTFKRTTRKFGRKRALKQAVAAGLAAARKAGAKIPYPEK